MTLPLAGRVAAITGASAGIGKACAEHFAAAGMPVALLARRGDRLEAVAAGIAARGGRTLVVPGDVTSEADVRALVDRAEAGLGRLDVMVANAGLGFHAWSRPFAGGRMMCQAENAVVRARP